MHYWKDIILNRAAWPAWVAPVVEIVVIIIAAWLVRVVVLGLLRQWAKRTSVSWDDAVVDLLDAAIKPLLVLAVLTASLNLLDLPPKLLRVSNRVLTVLVITVVLFYVSKIIQVLLDAWLSRNKERLSVREPIQFVTQVLFAGLALMIVLDNLGISLTAVWTTLGVGSVAIALALQDTLSNFFAGIYLRIDSPVRVGDYTKLDSGEEGFVAHMGWRSTRIRQLGNNMVIVPNSKLASAIVINYDMPESRMSLLINVGVSYEDDPDQVEKILIEEALAAAKTVPGLLADPAPFVRFIPGFGDSSLDFTLICQVSTYVDQYLAQHEIRKRILRRFREERVTIPFPQRDVHFYSETQPFAVVSEQSFDRAKPLARDNGGHV
jgi:small-conductance mechanosensitive channel